MWLYVHKTKKSIYNIDQSTNKSIKLSREASARYGTSQVFYYSCLGWYYLKQPTMIAQYKHRFLVFKCIFNPLYLTILNGHYIYVNVTKFSLNLVQLLPSMVFTSFASIQFIPLVDAERPQRGQPPPFLHRYNSNTCKNLVLNARDICVQQYFTGKQGYLICVKLKEKLGTYATKLKSATV